MKFSKIKSLFKSKSIPQQGEQTKTPIAACYNMDTPSKDTVVMKCSQQNIFKKIINRIIK